MADKEPIVYLADVEVATTVKEAKVSTPPVVTTTTAKRQRTLADMFGASEGKTPTAKKQKLTVSAVASAGSSKAPSTGLNAIAFSIVSFQESLSDEEKELLNLECEVMGESWYGNPTSENSFTHFCFAGSSCLKTK